MREIDLLLWVRLALSESNIAFAFAKIGYTYFNGVIHIQQKRKTTCPVRFHVHFRSMWIYLYAFVVFPVQWHHSLYIWPQWWQCNLLNIYMFLSYFKVGTCISFFHLSIMGNVVFEKCTGTLLHQYAFFHTSKGSMVFPEWW